MEELGMREPRIECPSEAWDRYCDAEERAHEPTDEEMIERLDGYGHLLYTVGNEDWCAALDFFVHGDRVAYHVVVDCESGGFTDTIESGVVRRENVEELWSLPWKYADLCLEVGSLPGPTPEDVEATAREWREAIESSLAEEGAE